MLDNAFTKAYHKDRHESTGGEALEVEDRYGEALADLLDGVHWPWRDGGRIVHAAGSFGKGAGHGRDAAVFSGAAVRENSVFQDFTFSGVALTDRQRADEPDGGRAAVLRRKKCAHRCCGGIFGVTLMLWICIQFYMFPLNFMSTSYLPIRLRHRRRRAMPRGYSSRQEAVLRRIPADYPNAGKRIATRLVVYFSRHGLREAAGV